MRPPAAWTSLMTFALLGLAQLLLRAPTALAEVDQGAACIGPACQRCITSCHCGASTPYCLHNTARATSQCVDGNAWTLMPPILFVHMPKTGGTTFRVAADQLLGAHSVCTDYGNGVQPPSPWSVVHKDVGDEFLDPAKTACRMLSGHVKAVTYVRDFGLRRSAVFLREPIARMVSGYHHVQRVENYQGTFREFLNKFRRKKSMNMSAGNLMTIKLNVPEIPLAAYGFVGITERYADSVRVFNDAFALDLHHSHENADPTPDDIPPGTQKSSLLEEFAEDLRLYQHALALFAERMRNLDACLPYAHGGVDLVKGGTVRGWAWWAHSDEAVEVAIVTGGVLVGYATASSPHRLVEWGVPRSGNVGFKFQLPSQPLTGEVCVFVRRTGQYLGPDLRHDLPVTDLAHPCYSGVALAGGSANDHILSVQAA